MHYPMSGRVCINLASIRQNWVTLQSQLQSGDCGAVVKANAYGLGMERVVGALFAEGCRHFFVASYREALQLRQFLDSEFPIFVLQGCPDGMEQDFVDAQFIPVLISMPMLDRWRAATKTLTNTPCALKLNTGMNRLGIEISDFETLLEQPYILREAGLRWLISHLACADTPRHTLNSIQLTRFTSLVARIRQEVPDIKASLANSPGIFLSGSAHFDLVRPGIALYGGSPVVDRSVVMKPVVSLHLPVLQVRALQRGEVVGYGAEYVAGDPKVVAVVAGGYADGLLRRWAETGRGWFNDYLPVLGRISMDSTVFDITHLSPEQRPAEGDEIEVLGEHLTIDDMAQAAGTISYEIITRLGDRLEKRYTEE